MSKTLVIRLSALGDVAMLIPVLYSCARKYPQENFLLITKKPLLSIFEHRPANIDMLGVDNKGKHKGIAGLIRLINELSKQNIKQIADTHNVLRSKIIRYYFRMTGRKAAVIDKGRKEKRALTRKHDKVFLPLKTSFERYYDVFHQLGYDFDIDFKSIFEYGQRDFELIKHITGTKNNVWIGIAPLAKHQGKIYPFEKMSKVIEWLASDSDKTIFLFGGKDEQKQLAKLAGTYPNVISTANTNLTFSKELLLMSYLDVMITMDSGNMHLASLVEIPVVSIWGATHPYTGFYGYKQDFNNVVQAELLCRPCSVFGNKVCYRNNYECMEMITPEMIVSKINFNNKP